MDLIFKCPQCDQELEVDASGAGSEITCPACSQTITVPNPEPANIVNIPTPPLPLPPAPKEGKHFVVPVHDKPADELIQKASKPLDVAAKEGDKKLRIKTFKHTDCQEVGKDRFDEIISAFLDKVGQANIVSINPINYSYVEMVGHHVVTDYGILVVYRG